MPNAFADLRAFARFALVGCLFAATNIVVLALLVSVMGLHYLTACTISFFVLNFLSYLLNKTFTFRLSRKVVAGEVVRYYLVMAASLAANLLLMYMLVDGLSLQYLLASAMVIVALSSLNFLGHAVFSFRPQRGEEQTLCSFDVLQVSAFFPGHGGGIEVVAGRLAHAWSNAGLRVAWCAGVDPTESAPFGSDSATLFPARYWDALEKRFGLPFPMWRPSALSALWRAMHQSRVVQLHDVLYTPCMMAMFFAWMQRKPVVLTQHIGELPIRSRLAREAVRLANKSVGRLMLSRADQVVFIASPVQAYFSGFVRFRNPPLLLANGVDHDVFHPSFAETSRSADIHLLFVGRFVEKKGVKLLRSSLQLPGVRWTFAGSGPLGPAQWPELPSTANLAGHVGSEQLASLYQQADLLVLPSIGEGFPLVVQEALACGTPVLVSEEVAKACPGRDPHCVFDVDVSEPGAERRVREKIESLVSDPPNLRMARTAAVAMAQQWSWDRCAEAYREIYARLSISYATETR